MRGSSWVPGHVGVNGGTAIEEHCDAHYRGGDEQLGVYAQPGKVQADLLSKVLPRVKGHIKNTVSESKDLLLITELL